MRKYRLKFKKNSILFFTNSKNEQEILFTNKNIKNITWYSDVDYFLECSGEKINKINFLIRKYKNINNLILSATSHDANKTLIYGFNHLDYIKSHKSISYGSCTVNDYTNCKLY